MHAARQTFLGAAAIAKGACLHGFSLAGLTGQKQKKRTGSWRRGARMLQKNYEYTLLIRSACQ